MVSCGRGGDCTLKSMRTVVVVTMGNNGYTGSDAIVLFGGYFTCKFVTLRADTCGEQGRVTFVGLTM